MVYLINCLPSLVTYNVSPYAHSSFINLQTVLCCMSLVVSDFHVFGLIISIRWIICPFPMFFLDILLILVGVGVLIVLLVVSILPVMFILNRLFSSFLALQVIIALVLMLCRIVQGCLWLVLRVL